MKKRRGFFLVFGLVAVLAFACTAAYAQQYQVEITPEYLREDGDNNFSVILAGFNGEIFFSPVNPADHPYAEASFLERVGSIFVSAARVDLKDDFLKGDGLFYGAGVNLAKPGFPLAVRAEFAATKVDYNEPITGDLKINAYDIRAGYYFMPALLAGVEYANIKTDFSLSGFGDFSSKTAEYGLFAKYVHELSGGRWLGFEGALGTSKFDDGPETLTNTRESLDVDYFFNRGLSAGVGIENNSGEDKSEEGMTYSANVNAFINPRFSVRAEYERFLNSNNDEPSDRAIDVALAARF